MLDALLDSSKTSANSSAMRDIAYHLHQQTNAREHEVVGPSIIVGGDRCYVTDIDGNRLFEGMSGLWCASLGFSEQRLVEAATRQMRTLPYYMDFRHASSEPLIDVSEMLVRRAPSGLGKAVFQSSGSEANDTALKLVWQFFNATGRPRKKKIISRIGGYHGTSISTGSITGLAGMHQMFDLPIDRFLKVSNPHFYRHGLPGESEEDFATRLAEELEVLILAEGADTIAAFFAEPVMASGGIIVPPRTYFEKIQAVLRCHDILFVVDEVICGFGRTGHYWGSEAYGLAPDLLTCAKALSSAYFPISATLVSDRIYESIRVAGDRTGQFAHGYTYGGHPVGAAIALETLKIYEEMDVAATVSARAVGFQTRLQRLAEHPHVGEVRGVGLCGAIEFVADKETRASFPAERQIAMQATHAARARGLIVRPIGQSIALAPPLIATDAEIEALFDMLEAALEDLVT